jgi:hypothetical protein
MMDSYLQREVPTSVQEEHNDMNEPEILWLTDDAIEFHVHNIEEMVYCNIPATPGLAIVTSESYLGS